MFFFDLLILLTFVWFSRKFFQLIKFPTIFGDFIAGLLAGPLILGLVHETEALRVLAELGIFFLMFHAGLESTPRDLFRSSKSAVFVAIGGAVLPFIGGYSLAYWYGYDFYEALFVALILSITSVAISARLFKDSKLSNSRVAHVTMTAAIMTEVVVLIIFSVFLDLAQTGQLSAEHIISLILKTIAYFAIVFYIGQKHFKYVYKVLYKGNKGFTFSIILALAFGLFAELIGLHMIIGAFLAGLFLRKKLINQEVYNKIEDRVYGLSYSFLGPIFFATLAFHIDLTAFLIIPTFIILIFFAAVLGKVLGAGLAAYLQNMRPSEVFGIGVAMNNRGALELIIASIALQEGVIDSELFSVLVIVAFGTTFLTVIAFKQLVPSIRDEQSRLTFKERLMRIVS